MDHSTPIWKENHHWIHLCHPHLLEVLTQPENHKHDEVHESMDLLHDDPDLSQGPPRYVIFYGMGQGEFAKSFFNKNQNNLFRLIIIEPHPAHFSALLHQYSYSQMLQDDRVVWLVGEDHQRLTNQLIQDLPELGIWGVTLFLHKQSRELFSIHFNHIQSIILHVIQSAQDNTRLLNERGLIIQHNIVRNLPYILHSYTLDRFHQQFQENPAIIVGAGPSLDKNIDELKSIHPNFLLIATDTSLFALLKRGIIPHVVMTCDPLKINARHFEPIPDLQNILLAYLPEVNHQILAKYPRHQYRLCLHNIQSKTLQALSNCFQVQTIFQRRMNAGHCAMWLAHQMGCSPLILIGMDLAVSMEGSSHARETQNNSQIEIDPQTQRARIRGAVDIQNNPIVSVPGYCGGTVYTFPHFANTLRKIEQEITEHDIKLINSTEGGAHIQGSSIMTLKEALRSFKSNKSIQSQWESCFSTTPSPNLQHIIPQIQTWNHSLQRIHHQTEVGKHKILQVLEHLYENDHELDENTQQLHTFVQRWKQLLHDPCLDTAMDTALARWRIPTQRIHWGNNFSNVDKLQENFIRLKELIEGLGKDILLFQQIYTQCSQFLKNGLTSVPREQ